MCVEKGEPNFLWPSAWNRAPLCSVPSAVHRAARSEGRAVLWPPAHLPLEALEEQQAWVLEMWMDEICSHHFETMVGAIACWHMPYGIELFRGFLRQHQHRRTKRPAAQSLASNNWEAFKAEQDPLACICFCFCCCLCSCCCFCFCSLSQPTDPTESTKR